MVRKNKHQNAVMNQAIQGVRLPVMLQCKCCDKYKTHDKYSSKQIADARSAIQKAGHNARYTVKCLECVGSLPLEITCNACGAIKPLEAFAKSQRKKLTEAECFTCTEKRMDVDPIDIDNYDQRRSHAIVPEGDYQPSVFDTQSTSNESSEWAGSETTGSVSGGVGLSEKFHRSLSITESSHIDTLNDAEIERGNGSSQNPWTKVTKSRGINSNSYGNPVASRSESGYQQSFSSSVAERSEEIITMGASGNFAKVKAYIPPKKNWSSDEENSGQGADDDDDDDAEL